MGLTARFIAAPKKVLKQCWRAAYKAPTFRGC